MGGDGAAGAGDEDFLKNARGANLLHAGIHDQSVAARMGHEYAGAVKPRAVSKAIGDVLLQNDLKFSSIFFRGTHTAVLDHDAGLEV